jgi:nucleoside-triphosphatase THEP1
MQKNVNVFVTGELANGKTTVAQIITNALAQHGFSVENKNVEDIPLSLERQKNKIDALTPITKINIHEVTTKNEPFLI